MATGSGWADAVDEESSQTRAKLVVIRLSLPTALACLQVIAADVLRFIVPNDYSAATMQKLVPHSVFFPRALSKGSGKHHRARIDGPYYLDVAADVIRFESGQRIRQTVIVVAAPTRHLRAADAYVRVRVYRVDRVGPGLQGSRECYVPSILCDRTMKKSCCRFASWLRLLFEELRDPKM